MNTELVMCTTRVPPEIKIASEEAARANGMKLSEFIRLSLMHFAATREVPFADKRAAYLKTGPKPRVANAEVAQ